MGKQSIIICIAVCLLGVADAVLVTGSTVYDMYDGENHEFIGLQHMTPNTDGPILNMYGGNADLINCQEGSVNLYGGTVGQIAATTWNGFVNIYGYNLILETVEGDISAPRPRW